jgi:hypothetical protein
VEGSLAFGRLAGRGIIDEWWCGIVLVKMRGSKAARYMLFEKTKR